MSESLKKAVSSVNLLEKTAFSGSVGRAVARAVEEKPFLTLAGIGTAGGILGSTLKSAPGGLTSAPTDTYSYQLDRYLNPGVSGALDRVKADELMASSITKNFSDIANQVVNKTVEELGKGYKKIIHRPGQQATLKELLDSDEMISQANPDQVANLFNTMVDIAPKMTKHREAVRSFLRQGLAHEGGLDPVLLGELAKAEARLKGKGLDAK